jgi:transposase InsO family protein
LPRQVAGIRGSARLAAREGAEPVSVAPGRPWENGYCESFNSRLRDEFLEAQGFESVADARHKAAWFRHEYNTVRPHSALRYKTLKQFSDECDRPSPMMKKDVSDPE